MELEKYEKLKEQNQKFEEARRILNFIDAQKIEIEHLETYKIDVFEIEIKPTSNSKNKPRQSMFFTGEQKNKILDVIIQKHEEHIQKLQEQFEKM